jgi:hypothetical protein
MRATGDYADHLISGIEGCFHPGSSLEDRLTASCCVAWIGLTKILYQHDVSVGVIDLRVQNAFAVG